MATEAAPVVAPPAPTPTPNPTPTPTPEPAATDWGDIIARDFKLAVGEPEQPKESEIPAVSMGRTLAEHSRIVDEEIARKAAEPPKEEKKDEATPPVEPPKTEVPAAPAAPPAPAATPSPEPEKPVVVEKKKPTEELVREQVRKALEESQKAKPEPAPVAPEPPKVDDYEATLDDAQKDELAIARVAAKRNPGKYGKLPDQLIGFYKKTDEFAQKARGEERTPEEADAEFNKFLKQNKPDFQVTDRRKFEREMIIEEAEARAGQKYQQELAEIKQKTHQLEVQPKIESGVHEFVNGLDGILAENESAGAVLKRAKEVGWEKAVEEDPVFAPIVANFQNYSTRLATEYLSVFGGAKKFNANNPDHVFLLDFVRSQGSHFSANGGDARIRDKKQFLPVAEYHQQLEKDPTVAERHWTFDHRDVLTRLATNTALNVEQIIKAEEAKLSKYGYKREKPAATPTPEPPKAPATPPAIPKVESTAPKKVEEASPKATTTSGLGPAKGADPVVAKGMPDWMLNSMNLPKV